MRTHNAAVKALVDDITHKAQRILGQRLGGVYAMGSLARGGFSEALSDIDLGIIIKGSLYDGDADLIDQIQKAVVSRHPEVKNDVSIFWGSVESINGETDDGRYPPFDRLDLIEHALLLAGEDLRLQLIKPTQRELEISNAYFALDYLGNQQVIKEFHDCEQITRKGAHYVSKTILYPARFIYVARTGKIAGNDVSHDFYVENYKGNEIDLVRLGYQLRTQPLPEDTTQISLFLEAELATLYQIFLDIYLARMAEYGETELHAHLLDWKRQISP